MTLVSHGLSVVYTGKRGGGMNLYFDLISSLKRENVLVKSFLSSSVRLEISKLELVTSPNFIYSP